MSLRASCIISLSILATTSSDTAAAARTNCAADEEIVFSCAAGKKTISLCASPGQARHSYVEYRFSARDGATPFSYRADKTSGSRMFNRATVIGASSASTVIWFENAGYVYEISDPVKGSRTVSVYKGGKQIGLHSCTGNYSGDSDTPNPFIKQRKSEDYFKILDESSTR